MRRGPLLCELHAHTTWSDGTLTVAELVDIHGHNGFDVLCVTDHVVRSDDPWREREGDDFSAVDEETWPAYPRDVEREAARASQTYGMLVIPGLELTHNDDAAPENAAHTVAVGLRRFVSVDEGIDRAMETAAEAGAALVAAHPDARESATTSGLVTKRFHRDPTLRALAHRFELFNRTRLYGWVAEEGLPAVASGDFHTPDHLAGWKTLLPSLRDETRVVEYLRSPRPAYLVKLDVDPWRLAA